MHPEHFHYEEADGIATVRLDRPERLNALTFESYRELSDAFLTLHARSSVRAIVLTGTGRAFCSGGDVQSIIGELFDVPPERVYAFARLTCDMIENMRRCEKPIVAALNGLVCGAGAVMAAAADVRIAAEEAKIGFIFTRVGLSGADMGAAWLLPRIVGLGHASELLMTGDFVDAARAAEIGLYNRVVPADELAGAALEMAATLASRPTLGMRITKRMLNTESHMSLAEAMQHEGWIQAECMLHPDFREGYDAATEKRSPDYASNADREPARRAR